MARQAALPMLAMLRSAAAQMPAADPGLGFVESATSSMVFRLPMARPDSCLALHQGVL